MPNKGEKVPRSPMNLILKRAVANLKKMPRSEKIPLLVKAERPTQEEADPAKRRLAENDSPAGAIGESEAH
jgi:hypothetical protein